MFRTRWAGLAALLALAACQDPVAHRTSRETLEISELSEGAGVFHRYVAVGTSISMGWQSDGAVGSDQENSWPAQLAAATGRPLTQPLIADPGCRSPLAAPLASGVRRSGEGAGASPASFACTPLLPGIELPTRNLAIAAATTRDALMTTPELQGDPFYRKLYPLVLPPGETQLSAALAHNPKAISVEFGGNEVLNARSGIAIPGVTLTPVATWMPQYTELVSRLAGVKHGVLVGLIRDVATFPSFRRGAELWADRATFLAAFHVSVDANCDGSQNLLFVPVRVPTAVGTGLAFRARGLPPYVLSCADGGLGAQDFVLTPSEAGVVNATMAAMNAHIAAEANRVGFAHFELEALYGRSDLKPPFSVIQLMTSASPYGAYTSLDGIHPNAMGHRELARAAAAALNTRYNLGIPTPGAFIASR